METSKILSGSAVLPLASAVANSQLIEIDQETHGHARPSRPGDKFFLSGSVRIHVRRHNNPDRAGSFCGRFCNRWYHAKTIKHITSWKWLAKNYVLMNILKGWRKNFERLAVAAGGLSGLVRCRCPIHYIHPADSVTRPRCVIIIYS